MHKEAAVLLRRANRLRRVGLQACAVAVLSVSALLPSAAQTSETLPPSVGQAARVKPASVSSAHATSTTVPLIYMPSIREFSIPVTIEGRKYQMLVDTGSLPGIAVDAPTGKRLKLEGAANLTVTGVQGKATAVNSTIHTVDVGNMQFHDVLISVIPSLKNLLPNSQPILGPGMFYQSRVTFDFADRTMTIDSGKAPTPAPSDPLSVTIPFVRAGGKVLLPVTILGKPTMAMLDSGCNVNFLSNKFGRAASSQLTPTDIRHKISVGYFGVGTTVTSIMQTMFRVPVPISVDVPEGSLPLITTSQYSGGGIGADDLFDVLLGVPFLKQFRRVTIDFTNNTITFQYSPDGNLGFGYETAVDRLFPRSKRLAFPGYQWNRIGRSWGEVPIAEAILGQVQDAALKTPSTKSKMNSIVVDGTEINLPSGMVLTEHPSSSVTVDMLGKASNDGAVAVKLKKNLWSYPDEYTPFVRSNGTVVFVPSHGAYSLKRAKSTPGASSAAVVIGSGKSDTVTVTTQSSSKVTSKTTIVVTTMTTVDGKLQPAVTPNIVAVDATILTLPPGYGAIKGAKNSITPKSLGTLQKDGTVAATINEKSWIYPRNFVPIVSADGAVEFKNAGTSHRD